MAEEARAEAAGQADRGDDMRHAKDFLTDDEQQQLRDAIREAERGTSGEIVPVVAVSSGRYDRAEDVVGLVCGSALLSVAWGLFQGVNLLPAEWGPDYILRINLPLVLGLFLFGFAAGALAATIHPPLCRIFIRKREMDEEVERRAAEAFYRFGIGNTSGGTGILLYISLFERRVVVLGDKTVSEKVSAEEWNAICSDLISGIGSGDAFEGLRKAIIDCGAVLKKHLPRSGDDVNELKDEIHFVD